MALLHLIFLNVVIWLQDIWEDIIILLLLLYYNIIIIHKWTLLACKTLKLVKQNVHQDEFIVAALPEARLLLWPVMFDH